MSCYIGYIAKQQLMGLHLAQEKIRTNIAREMAVPTPITTQKASCVSLMGSGSRFIPANGACSLAQLQIHAWAGFFKNSVVYARHLDIQEHHSEYCEPNNDCGCSALAQTGLKF